MKKPSRLLLIVTGAMLASFAGGFALAAQPHMHSALKALENSKAELEAASTDKAGHRQNAIDLIDKAILEVQAGITAGAE